MKTIGARHVVALDDERFITLSPEAHIVYEGRRLGQDAYAIAATLSRYCRRQCSIADVERAIDVITANVAGVKAEKRGAVRLLRLTLIPAPWVNAVARRLTWLFDPVVAVGICAITLAAVLLSIASHLNPSFSTRASVGAYILFLLSVIAHEFGHATATRAAGERAGPIGFTAFFMFPALYTDVSRAWLLRRGQRVAVDIGGVYFQLPFLAAFAAGAAVTHSATLFLAELSILAGIALNLNFVLRFDGYWLLADALDLPQLAREPLRMLAAVMRGETPLPGRARWQAAVVAGYGACNIIAWTWVGVVGVTLLAHRPADLLAELRLASIHFNFANMLQLGLTLSSIVLLSYGLTALGRNLRRSLALLRKGIAHESSSV